MIILGLDPGTTRAGYGLIKKQGSRLSLLTGGILKTDSSSPADILADLTKHLNSLISEFNPDIAGIEKLYFSKNSRTAMSVSEARGALLATLRNNNIPVSEFDPSTIKASITGSGRASKSEVTEFVRLILGQPQVDWLDDTYDALAIAIMTADNLNLK